MPRVRATDCCGVGEIATVGGYAASTIETYVRSARNDYHMGLVYATTTQLQRTTEPELEKAGFTVVREFRNPNSGNTIKFWVRFTEGDPQPKTVNPRFATPRKTRVNSFTVWREQ